MATYKSKLAMDVGRLPTYLTYHVMVGQASVSTVSQSDAKDPDAVAYLSLPTLFACIMISRELGDY